MEQVGTAMMQEKILQCADVKMSMSEVALFCDFTVLGTSVERSKQAYPCSLTATVKYHRLYIIIFIWSSLFSIKKISTFFFFLFCLAFLGHEFVDLCFPQKKEEKKRSKHAWCYALLTCIREHTGTSTH